MSNTYRDTLCIALTSSTHGSAELLSKVYTDEEAAAIAGCDTDTLAAKANNLEVPGIKWGRGWRYPALAFHLSLNLHAAMAIKQPSNAGGSAASTVGSHAPAANDPAPTGRRKPRAAPALPTLKTGH